MGYFDVRPRHATPEKLDARVQKHVPQLPRFERVTQLVIDGFQPCQGH